MCSYTHFRFLNEILTLCCTWTHFLARYRKICSINRIWSGGIEWKRQSFSAAVSAAAAAVLALGYCEILVSWSFQPKEFWFVCCCYYWLLIKHQIKLCIRKMLSSTFFVVLNSFSSSVSAVVRACVFLFSLHPKPRFWHGRRMRIYAKLEKVNRLHKDTKNGIHTKQ